MIDQQSFDASTVSKATYRSKGIINAVKDSLEMNRVLSNESKKC